MTSRHQRQLRRQRRDPHALAGWLLAAAMTVLLAACSADTGTGGDASETVAPTETTTASTTSPSTTATPDTTTLADPMNAPPSPPVQGMPDCTGGVAILDTTVLDSRVVIRESLDARAYCIEDEQYGGTIGNIPEEGSVQPALTGSGMYGRAYYHFDVPADFPAVVSVYDENGVELPAARGRAGHYLVVIDPPAGGSTADIPQLVQRVLDVRDETGATVTQLMFMGFAASDVATFEQFIACVRDAGVDFAVPGPGEVLPPAREPSDPAALQVAWASCADLMFSYFAGNQQSGPEFIQNQRFEMDCLAAAGFYPMLNEPVTDVAAHNAASDKCRADGPGRAALVECLRANGLDVVATGVQSAGPYPLETVEPAWQACRDTFVVWGVQSPVLVPDIIGPMDCLATKGLIGPMLTPQDTLLSTDVLLAQNQCRTGA